MTVAITALPRVKLPAFEGDALIQPGCREGTALPFSDTHWFQYAMKPADDEMVDEMIEIGKAHARAWLQEFTRAPASQLPV